MAMATPPARGGGGRLLRVLRAHSFLPKRADLPPISFEADWSGISAAALSDLLKELLETLVGLPPDPDKTKRTRRFGWDFLHSADITDIYSRKHFAEGAESGFLVRGVIYDMSALIKGKNPSSNSESTSVSSYRVDQSKAKDWTSLIHENLNLQPKEEAGNLQNVDATEVMERLGLKGVAGIGERVESTKLRIDSRKSKLEAKQLLEEVMGRGDSIRAKYAERIQQKKMLAEARREQAKLGITPVAAPRFSGPGTGIEAMPGSAALVRYLEERGLNQALLAHGLEGDFEALLDQIGNYRFGVVKRIQSANLFSSNDEVLRTKLVEAQY